jgi:transposase-like protein
MTRYNTEEKAKLLKQWKARARGLGVCRKNGIKGQTFSKWVKKQSDGGKKFVELKGAGIAGGPGEIVIKKGGIHIRLPFGMSGKEIRAVMGGAWFLP